MDTEPAWEYVPAQPCPKRRTRILVALAATAVSVGVLCIAWRAFAQVSIPHEIMLIYPGSSYDSVSQTLRILGPDPFADKATCEKKVKGLRVWMQNHPMRVTQPAMVRCDPVEISR